MLRPGAEKFKDLKKFLNSVVILRCTRYCQHMEATNNKGEDSMNEQEIKAEANRLGLPTSEEILLFAQRLNSVAPHEVTKAAEADLKEYAINVNFLKRCSGGVEKLTNKLIDREATESNDLQVGKIMKLQNTKPQYLQGVLVQIVEVEKKSGGKTIIWAKIAEEIGKAKDLGMTVGYPATCFTEATASEKLRTNFDEYAK
jgi:hypothetical protein